MLESVKFNYFNNASLGSYPPPSANLIQELESYLSQPLQALYNDLQNPNFSDPNYQTKLYNDLEKVLSSINTIMGNLSPSDAQEFKALINPLWNALTFQAPGQSVSLLVALQESDQTTFMKYMQYFGSNLATAGAQLIY